MKKLLFLCNSSRSYSDISAVIQNMHGVYAAIYELGTDFSETDKLIKEMQPDAVISLPFAMEYIQQFVSCPVILLQPSQVDIISSLHAAAPDPSEPVYYIGYHESSFNTDLGQMELILQRKIKLMTYRSMQERQIILQRLARQNIRQAVVTTPVARDILRHMGIDPVLLHWNTSSVHKAIDTARDVIASLEKESQRSEWLMQVLDNIQDGIIGINKDVITEFNAQASNIFGLSPAGVLGKNRDQLSGKSSLSKLLDQISQSKEKEFLQDIRGRLYLVAEIAVNESQRLLFLKDKSEINRLQANFRREAERRGLTAKYEFSDIIGSCASIQRCIRLAQRYAESDATILIQGDTGTGKELFAQSIHNASNRSRGPFVSINCAAIPEDILESELFGYEGGSFTGARKEGKPGLFELANSGTLFLDEIGEMPLQLQASILRVLQNKEIMHLGGGVMIPVDVRIIAATNRDLEQALQQNVFRRDLYYRLSILALNVPSLRERAEDIPLLIAHFQRQYEEKYHKVTPPVSAEMIGRFCKMDWPGNIRELEGMIERYVILSDEDAAFSIDEKFAQPGPQENAGAPQHLSVKVGALRAMELEILRTLSRYYSDVDMSEILQISRSTIWRKLRETKD